LRKKILIFKIMNLANQKKNQDFTKKKKPRKFQNQLHFLFSQFGLSQNVFFDCQQNIDAECPES